MGPGGGGRRAGSATSCEMLIIGGRAKLFWPSENFRFSSQKRHSPDAGASRQGGVEANASTLGLGGRNFYILEGGFGTQGGGGQGGMPPPHRGGGMDAPVSVKSFSLDILLIITFSQI